MDSSDQRDFADRMEVAKKVRNACIKAAQEGFRDASMSGLCMEGAIESAVGSIQSLNLENILKKQD
ncbi:acetyltransferase [Aliifodinibius sp. S!AR15-10]|uniref:acetyltransferase n=1 Tax=Aliifodinibius sp. S!AR15-10 TaxID=2950437 RepID=UPI002854C868|nr:acetyltransferase [Aliifodinibius sp. S!AR15-10]MDR8389958.1 acetyltransferase [Aliifodinibius sp. S!AR15-10]